MKRFCTLVVGAVLVALPLAAARGDIPNPFEPEKPSTSAVTTAVFSCIESAQKSAAGKTKRWALKYCGCMMDAMLLRRSSLSPDLATACAAHAERTASEQAPSRSPYQGTEFLGSEAIAAADLGCDDNIKQKFPMKSPTYRVFGCSCMGDLIRQKRETNFDRLAKDKLTFCEQQAERAEMEERRRK